MAKILLIEGELQAPLSHLIQKEYHALATIVASVPDILRLNPCIKGTGGLVSLSHIIAYQIGWGRLLLGWYEAGLQGNRPEMPGEGFTTWDYTGLALHFYQKYLYEHPSSQDREFHQIVQKIIQMTEQEYRTGNLDKTGIWSWCRLKSGKEWPLSKWITVNTVAPYKKAAREARQIKQR